MQTKIAGEDVGIEAQPKIDLAAFQGIEWMLKYVAPETEADKVGLLVTFLTAFGNIAGRSSYYQVAATKHYPNIFAVLVGASSKARKGTSMDIVKEIFRQIDEAWVQSNIKSGMSSGEGIKYHVRDEVKKINRHGEEVIADPGVTDKRVLLHESEFAQPLRVSRKPGNTLSTTIRDLWDHGNQGVLTKKDPFSITDAHISILGHITNSELVKNLSETDATNGFANRLLWLYVSRGKLQPQGGNIKYDKIPHKKIAKAIEFAGASRQITMSVNAKAKWERLYTELSKEQIGMLGAIVCRAEAQVIRLSLLYALLDCSKKIEIVHLNAAMALWKYCEDSAKYIFGEKFGNPTVDRILSEIKSIKPGGLTKTQIHQLFGNNKRSSEIDNAIAELLQFNLVKPRKNKTKGRPEIVYELNEKN